MVEEVEEKKERQEIRVRLDYAKTMRLFKIVVTALPAQMDGHQQVDVIQDLDVQDQDLVTGGGVVGLKQLLIFVMMIVLMNMK